MPSAALTTRQLRARRTRRRVANWALGWALTFGGIGVFTGFATNVLLEPDNYNVAISDVDTDPAVRAAIAGQILEAAGITAPTEAQTAAVTAALAPSAVADVLQATRTAALDDGGQARAFDLRELAPTLDPYALGTYADDVTLLVQAPDLGWVATWLPKVSFFSLLFGLLLALIAGFSAVNRIPVLNRLGRWGLSTSVVVVGSGWAAANLLPETGSALAVVVASLVGVASAASLPLAIGVASAGATSMFVSAGLRSRSLRATGRQIDSLEFEYYTPSAGVVVPTTVDPDAFVPVDAVPDRSRPTSVSVAAPAAAGKPVMYWELQGHPQLPPTGVRSAVMDLSEAEQRDLAVASVRAWVAGSKASLDDAELLELLVDDRQTYVQLARFWEQFAGKPFKAATAILAYQDIVAHGEGYAQMLDMPHWALTQRVGQLTQSVQDEGLDGVCAKLRAVYIEVAVAVTAVIAANPSAAIEYARLNGIAAALNS
jgi:hypothetical protein